MKEGGEGKKEKKELELRRIPQRERAAVQLVVGAHVGPEITVDALDVLDRFHDGGANVKRKVGAVVVAARDIVGRQNTGLGLLGALGRRWQHNVMAQIVEGAACRRGCAGDGAGSLGRCGRVRWRDGGGRGSCCGIDGGWQRGQGGQGREY